jgi:hypothetical protein
MGFTFSHKQAHAIKKSRRWGLVIGVIVVHAELTLRSFENMFHWVAR